jgi:4'-phosphopantetheinyl transferase
MLSAEERRRAAGFRFERDRARWVSARRHLRSVLAGYLSVEPDALRFDESPRRRPTLRWPSRCDWLHFSLTHSGELALVAVARDRDVGVDVEVVRPDRDLGAIARRAFGDGPADALDAESPGERVRSFYRAWVRHEAHGKCLGTGVVEPDRPQAGPLLDTRDLDLEAPYVGAVAVCGRLGRLRSPGV